jgi:hypothetical protein
MKKVLLLALCFLMKIDAVNTRIDAVNTLNDLCIRRTLTIRF